jgi:hypothetical protein
MQRSSGAGRVVGRARIRPRRFAVVGDEGAGQGEEERANSAVPSSRRRTSFGTSSE